MVVTSWQGKQEETNCKMDLITKHKELSQGFNLGNKEIADMFSDMAEVVQTMETHKSLAELQRVANLLQGTLMAQR